MLTLVKVLAIVIAALFAIYFFNLDMKLVSVIYTALGKRFDRMKREDRL